MPSLPKLLITETTRMNIAGLSDASLWVIVRILAQGMSSLHGDDRSAAVQTIFAAIDELRVREGS